MAADMTVLELLNGVLKGRYVIEREIGRGGMATVYFARDSRHDRSVALKVLDPELGAVVGMVGDIARSTGAPICTR